MRIFCNITPALNITRRISCSYNARQYTSLVQVVQCNRPHNNGNIGSTNITLRKFHNEHKSIDKHPGEKSGSSVVTDNVDTSNANSILPVALIDLNPMSSTSTKILLFPLNWSNGNEATIKNTLTSIFSQRRNIKQIEAFSNALRQIPEFQHNFKTQTGEEELHEPNAAEGKEQSLTVYDTHGVQFTGLEKEPVLTVLEKPTNLSLIPYQPTPWGSLFGLPENFNKALESIGFIVDEKFKLSSSPDSKQSLSDKSYSGSGNCNCKKGPPLSLSVIMKSDALKLNLDEFLFQRKISYDPLNFSTRAFCTRFVDAINQSEIKPPKIYEVQDPFKFRLRKGPTQTDCIEVTPDSRHSSNDSSYLSKSAPMPPKIRHISSPFVSELLGGHKYPMTCDTYRNALIEAAKLRAALKNRVQTKRLKDCNPNSSIVRVARKPSLLAEFPDHSGNLARDSCKTDDSCKSSERPELKSLERHKSDEVKINRRTSLKGCVSPECNEQVPCTKLTKEPCNTTTGGDNVYLEVHGMHKIEPKHISPPVLQMSKAGVGKSGTGITSGTGGKDSPGGSKGSSKGKGDGDRGKYRNPNPCADVETEYKPKCNTDPCGSLTDPCKKPSQKCPGNDKKSGPCAKKDDPCTKKDDKMKTDSCAKSKSCAMDKNKSGPCIKKDVKKKSDPCAKKDDKKKPDPCAKKDVRKCPCDKKDDKKKIDPCAKKGEKKPVDPCAKKEKKPDPCAKKDKKQPDPCAKKEKKPDPCAKKDKKQPDPCAKKEKKPDPCAKKEKKPDPCAKKEKKPDPCAKKEKKPDPCAKKDKKPDPCAKREKKPDPCAKKEKKPDPCAKKEKKPDPCAKKEKKPDPCAKKEKKPDPCAKKEKKPDPCAKKEKKPDPCAKKEDKKKVDPCAKQKKPDCKQEQKIYDPCAKKEKKTTDPCAKKEKKLPDICGKQDKKPSDKQEKKIFDPCGKKQKKNVDPCAKKQKDTKPICKPKDKSTKKCFSTNAMCQSQVDLKPKVKYFSTLALNIPKIFSESQNKNHFDSKSRIRALNNNLIGFGFMRHFSSKGKKIKKDINQGLNSKCKSLATKKPPNRRKNINPHPKDGLRLCYPDYDMECPRKLCKDPRKTACSKYAFLKDTDNDKRKENKKFINPYFYNYQEKCLHLLHYPSTFLMQQQNRRFHTSFRWRRNFFPKDLKFLQETDRQSHISAHELYDTDECNDDGRGKSSQSHGLFNEALSIKEAYKVERVVKDVPHFSDYDVLVSTSAVAISGSDIHIYENGSATSPDITLGHDAAGVVVKTGQCITELKPGDRVAMESSVACGICDFCKRGEYNMCFKLLYNGFFMKYQAHPADLCHKIPDTLSMAEAALSQTLALGCQAVSKANITPTKNILIMGSGPTAVASAFCAHAKGARDVVVMCTMREALESMRDKLSLKCVHYKDGFNFQEVLETIFNSFNDWPDVVVNCAINEETMNIAAMALKPCGICILAQCDTECASFNALDVLMKNIKLVPSFRSANMFPTAIHLMSTGCVPISKIIASSFHWDNVAEAFRAAQHESNCGYQKVFVECGDKKDNYDAAKW